MRRFKTHALYRSKLWQQDHCQQIWTVSTLEGTAQRIGRTFVGGGAKGHIMPPHIFEVDLKVNSKVYVRGCAEECGDPMVQSGRRWLTLDVAAGLGAGPQVQRDSGFASEGLLWLCTLLSLAPLLPQPEPAGLIRLVIRREYHQHDLPQHQSQPDYRHPPSISRIFTGGCGKGMLPFPDLYRAGGWGWRWLHWIDVSSTT